MSADAKKDPAVLDNREREIISNLIDFIFTCEDELKEIYNKLNPSEKVYYTNLD